MMNWILHICFFIIGTFCGLVLFAWLEKELITKLLLLKAEIIYCIQTELKPKKRGKSCSQ